VIYFVIKIAPVLDAVRPGLFLFCPFRFFVCVFEAGFAIMKNSLKAVY
jgi:hypothetical protein